GILYSVGRFWIEGLRTDSLMFMGMRQAQIISMVIIAAFTAMIVYRRKKNKDKAGEDTEDIAEE
ncbi:MAG: prolipoprotein diacylglyceryl transferase, partial [Clostridiaceae bacterium]|nr:prolipoprotein diacylglyceryl transferase [Clostridiaceae bacterium]